MKRLFLLVTLIVLFALNVISISASRRQDSPAKPKQSKSDAKIVAAVRAVLDAQAAAWNRGDIEGFMDGYARSGETVFVSGDTVTRGWQTVLNRYKRGYNTREKMGQLDFTDLEITPLGKDAAVALGRWQLTRAEDKPHGRFTLIFRRTPQGWRIVHDHTSSASP
jgi:beta-aspartyl-peptidase (threonine type)